MNMTRKTTLTVIIVIISILFGYLYQRGSSTKPTTIAELKNENIKYVMLTDNNNNKYPLSYYEYGNIKDGKPLLFVIGGGPATFIEWLDPVLKQHNYHGYAPDIVCGKYSYHK